MAAGPPPAIGSALRNGAVYAAGTAFQRGIIFLLLPVYTRVLDPAAYGRLSILLAIAAVAIVLFSCGMDTAFFRTYFLLREDPETQRRFVTTAWVFLLIVPPAIAAVFAVVAFPLFSSGNIVSPVEIAVALAGAALFVSGTVVPLSLLRAQERLRDFVILTVVTGGSTAGFTVLFVVGLDGGVIGWLVGVVVANAVTLIAAVRIIPLRLTTGVDRLLLTGALAMGLPLIPHILSHWGLGISNRLVLAGIVPETDVGIYTLAANVVLPVAIAMSAISTAFFPSYARAATEEAARIALRRVIIVQYVVVLVLAIGGALLGPIAVRYLAPPDYSEAADVAPWIALGFGFYGLYFLPMNAVALTAGRTGKVWMVTVTAAAVNLGALLLLVPVLDLVGAGISVAVGYLVLLVGVLIYSHGADNPVRYEWGKLARGVVVLVAVYAFATATTGDRTLVDGAVRLAWIGTALPLLILARVIDRGLFTAALRRLSSRRRLAPSL